MARHYRLLAIIVGFLSFQPLHAQVVGGGGGGGVQAIDVGGIVINAPVSGDNTGLINGALTQGATFSPPRNVILGAGSYHIINSININPGQCLIGAGWNTIIDVDSDFNTSATGILKITSNTNPTLQSCIRNLQVYEHLPPDITATASAAILGATAITIAAPTGTVTNGMNVYDNTTPAAIPIANGQIPFTVSSVVGTTVNLSTPLLAAVNNGDVIHFAQPRSGFANLGTCSTSTAGGAPCKYPWAIYAASPRAAYVDNVIIGDAWDGAYFDGPNPHIGFLQIAAFDQGLSIGNGPVGTHNFPQVDDYEFWNFGISTNTAAYAVASEALSNVFYDGSTIALSVGATDGAAFGKVQIWTGKVNFNAAGAETTAFTFAHFNSLMLDGNNANLNINDCNWVQIANLYTTKGILSSGVPIVMNPANTNCQVTISNFIGSGSNASNNFITVANGTLAIESGKIQYAPAGASPPAMASISGGTFVMRNVRVNGGSPGTGWTYINNTAGIIDISGNVWTTAPNGGGSTAVSSVDNALSMVNGNVWNGWAFSSPGASGFYSNNK